MLGLFWVACAQPLAPTSIVQIGLSCSLSASELVRNFRAFVAVLLPSAKLGCSRMFCHTNKATRDDAEFPQSKAERRASSRWSSFVSLPLSRTLAGCTNGCLAGNWASACALTGNIRGCATRSSRTASGVSSFHPQKEAETRASKSLPCVVRLSGCLTA